MAKKNVTIKFDAETKEAESGINKLASDINKFSKNNQQSLKGLGRLTNSVKGLAKSFAPATIAIGATIAALKKVNEVVQETTTLYKAQANAEKQLEVAARNNPYLDSTSVAQLKAYASQLQSISTVGDEQLLPMMAQLASAGRTQSEIQDIMSAALDVSASGMMSLDSAVTALNKTYSGTAGQLGNQISQIKKLTKEELESGKAVEIVAQKFKGMAEETAKATGSSEQLKNAIADYKEEIGASFEKNLSPMRKFFTELISGWASAKKAKREYEEAAEQNETGQGTVDSLSKEIAQLEKKSEELYDKIFALKDPDKRKERIQMSRGFITDKQLDQELEALQNQRKANEELLRLRRQQKKETELAEAAAKKAAEEQAKADEEEAAKVEEANKLLERRNKLREDYAEALRKTQAEIANRRNLGEEISAEAEAQELLNVATSHYIAMYSDAAFDRSQTKTGIWEGEKEHLAFIDELAAQIPVEKKVVEKSKSHVEELIDAWQKEKEETLEMQKELLDEYMAYLKSKGKLTDEEIALKQKLENAQKNIDEEILKQQKEAQQKQKDNIASMVSDIADYVEQFADITGQITALARENNEQETQEELAEISKQYTDGLISYEEYCEKKKEIARKAAREEYKLKMWEWSASLIQATANIAEGVAKAIAQGGVAGIITGALVAASGAIQIATITANKPKAPSFATGGIVQGTSYSGDRVRANVNSGEMILNAQQQANLWKAANSSHGMGATVNMPVTIENNASDKVNANAQVSPDGLRVIINQIVSSEMERGTYTQSMHIAQSRENGIGIY